jgi:hypothetical protein
VLQSNVAYAVLTVPSSGILRTPRSGVEATRRANVFAAPIVPVHRKIELSANAI